MMMTLKFLIYQQEYDDYCIKCGYAQSTQEQKHEWDNKCIKSIIKYKFGLKILDDRRREWIEARLNVRTGKPL